MPLTARSRSHKKNLSPSNLTDGLRPLTNGQIAANATLSVTAGGADRGVNVPQARGSATVDIVVRLLDELPASPNHGARAGHARFSLNRPANSGANWTAEVQVQRKVKQADIQFIVGLFPERTTARFENSGLHGGHDDARLRAFVRNNPEYELVLIAQIMGYKANRQVYHHPSAAGAQRVTIATPPKTTCGDIRAFLREADPAVAKYFHDHPPSATENNFELGGATGRVVMTESGIHVG
jgi:hypothetical protein